MAFIPELCDCSCAKPCPLRKTGSQTRCQLKDLATHFGCREDEAMDRLHAWWPQGEAEIHQRFQEMQERFGPIKFTVVEAARPE